MKGDSWVAIWTVYIMVMLQAAYWMDRPLDPWVSLIQAVLGGYVVHGTVTKAVSSWRNRAKNIVSGE